MARAVARGAAWRRGRADEAARRETAEPDDPLPVREADEPDDAPRRETLVPDAPPPVGDAAGAGARAAGVARGPRRARGLAAAAPGGCGWERRQRRRLRDRQRVGATAAQAASGPARAGATAAAGGVGIGTGRERRQRRLSAATARARRAAGQVVSARVSRGSDCHRRCDHHVPSVPPHPCLRVAAPPPCYRIRARWKRRRASFLARRPRVRLDQVRRPARRLRVEEVGGRNARTRALGVAEHGQPVAAQPPPRLGVAGCSCDRLLEVLAPAAFLLPCGVLR